MTLVCHHEYPPYEFDYIEEDDILSTVFNLGYVHYDEDMDFILRVGFHLNTDTNIWEYIFAIDATYPDGRVFERYMDGKDTKCDILGPDRVYILQVLCSATRELLSRHPPSSFIMETFKADLPSEALRKYDLVNDVFRETGYVVTKAPSAAGRHVWTAQRQPHIPFGVSNSGV